MNDEKSLKTITTAVYALQAVGFFVGLTWIVAVVMNYVKRDDVRGTFLDSHFGWQIRTFWYALLWAVLAMLLVVTIIGLPLAWVLAVVVGLWVLYRIVRGWLALVARRPMPT